jgi:hypothetical protein
VGTDTDLLLRWAGLLAAVSGVLFCLGWAVLTNRDGTRSAIGSSAFLVLGGIAMTQAHRSEEVFGAKFREQAQADAAEVAKIRANVENHAAQIAEVARQANEMRELLNDVRETQNDQVRYARIAELDFAGFRIEGGVIRPTPLTWGRGKWSIEDGKYIWKCDDSAISSYRALVEANRDFPFPAVALADCLDKKGDPSWREVAESARDVLSRTTKVPRHHTDHETFLRRVEEMLDAPVR